MPFPKLRMSLAVLATLATTTSAIAIEPFDSARSAANDVIARAQAAGNDLLEQLGQMMLETIDAAEQSAISIIEEGEDAATTVIDTLMADIDVQLERLAQERDITFDEVGSVTANWASLVSRLPFVDGSAEVMMYRPRVISPLGSRQVAVTVVGPGLADGFEAAMTSEGAEIEVNLSSDNEIVLLMDREDFGGSADDTTFASISISYDAAPPSVWWRPGTWFASDIVEREMTFLVMPETLATYQIDPIVQVERTQRDRHSATTNARGQDSVVRRTVGMPADLEALGWDFDVAAIRGGDWVHARIRDRGGSSCTGIDRDELRPHSIVFTHQIGHQNGFPNNSDGWVDCRVELPMVRITDDNVAADPISGTVPINSDILEDLPARTVSYRTTVTLFDGRTFIAADETAELPFSTVDVSHPDGAVQFRPRTPRDF